MSVVEWARRHTPEAILIPTALATGTATVLTNVPEVFSLGQELGLGVMGVGYSYIAAYVFNWLVVTRPRGQALRDYYDATWADLTELTVTSSHIISRLQEWSREKHHDISGLPQLRRMLESIDWDGVVDTHEIYETVTDAARRHDRAYSAILPVMQHFEPTITAKLAALNDVTIRNTLEVLLDQERTIDTLQDRYGVRDVALGLWLLQEKGDQLSDAMMRSKHRPT